MPHPPEYRLPQPDPTPEERRLAERIHELKVKRMRTTDAGELADLQNGIYDLSQQIVIIRRQAREKC